MSCFAQKRQPSNDEFVCAAKVAASFRPPRTTTIDHHMRRLNQQIGIDFLSDMLDDDFVSHYLVAFSQTELSNENVLFLVAVRSYEKKLNESMAGALQLAHCIFEDHLQPGSPLEVGVTPQQRHYIEDSLFKWNASGTDMPPRPPKGLFASPYRSVYRTVAFDIIPRFRQSIHCKELSKLHLSRTLAFKECRDLLHPAFGSYEREIVDFWLGTNDFETQYTALASGWPTSSTIAVEVLKTHGETIAKLVSAEQLTQLQRKSVEAPIDLFKVPVLAALNALCAPYEEFLGAPSSATFLAFLNVALVIRSAPAPFPSKDETGYTAGW